MDVTGPDLPDAVCEQMVRKAEGGWTGMFMLAVFAGMLIGFGSIGYLVVQGVAEVTGPVQLLSGLAFSVGLILVMVTGAELFTGNTMMLQAVSRGSLTAARLAGAWSVVWTGNLIGSCVVAALFVAAGGGSGLEGLIGEAAVSTAVDKVTKGPGMLIASGILANMLVCLAVWAAIGARTIGGKVAAIVGPVTLFVAAGFEHSIANMSLLPIGWLLDDRGAISAAAVTTNLALSTLGNVIGGGFVALLLDRALVTED